MDDNVGNVGTIDGNTNPVGTITGSVSIPSSAAAPVSTTPALPAFAELVPADYKEKPWVQDLLKSDDPYNAFFKGYENAQVVIGKNSSKVEIPGEGAPDDAVKAFHKAIGVPDSPDGYQYQTPDISKETEQVQKFLQESMKDDSLLKSVQTEAHKLGITPKQFSALAAVVDGWNINQAKSIMASMEQQQTEFAQQQREKFNGVFGDRSEAVEKLAKETVGKVLSKEVLATKDPEIALAAAMAYIHEKVFKNDSVLTGNQTSLPTELSKDQLQAKIFELRARKEYQDKMHPGHKALHADVDELYKEYVAKG